MFILEITSESCNDLVLAKILSLLHTIFNIIGIAVPILLTVSAVISLISMLTNPEQKDGMKKIINKFMAAVIVFFIPTITDLAIQLVPGTSFSVSACWKTADNAASDITYANTDSYSNWKQSSTGDVGGNLQLLAKYANADTSGNKGGINNGGTYDPVVCSAQYLNGGMRIPIYYQNNPNCNWGEFREGQSVAGGGCGFTSLAMILSYMTGQTITPADMARKYSSYYYNNSGMSWSLITKSATDYGLTQPRQISASQVEQTLRNNQPVILRGPGSTKLFSDGPHFIILRGIDSNGGIYVSNPNYYRNDQNTQTFTMAQISSWATNYWAFPAKAN